MKSFYIVAQKLLENGKSSAFVIRCGASDNIITKLNIPGLQHANICESKKRAEQIAILWNDIELKRTGA